MLNVNEIILSQYRIIDLVGKGGMGRVYLAKDIVDGSLKRIFQKNIHISFMMKPMY